MSLLAKPASSFRVAMHFTSLLLIMLELDSDGEKISLDMKSPPLQISVLISHQKNQKGKMNVLSLG